MQITTSSTIQSRCGMTLCERPRIRPVAVSPGSTAQVQAARRESRPIARRGAHSRTAERSAPDLRKRVSAAAWTRSSKQILRSRISSRTALIGSGVSSPLSTATSTVAALCMFEPRVAGTLSCSCRISRPAWVRCTRRIVPAMLSLPAGAALGPIGDADIPAEVCLVLGGKIEGDALHRNALRQGERGDALPATLRNVRWL